ncbi:protein PAF1 homolog [Solanum tuberosum]|uniref:protein PAF1 homolog n=1 Tax=Solanum tuberosum TaxID=4113 RepID=UPI0003D29257|nr:PREDICTED: protein PAF1 homolog [Solanum tuberosum]
MSQFRQNRGYRVKEGSSFSYQYVPLPPLPRNPYSSPPPHPPDSLYPHPPPPPPSPTPCPPPPFPPSSFPPPFSLLRNRYPPPFPSPSCPPPPSQPRFRPLPPFSCPPPPSQTVRFKQPAPLPVKNSNETEEERRLRKKRELEKVRRKQRLREAQNRIVEKTKKLFSGRKGHASIRSDRSIAPLLRGDMTDNRLEKQQLKYKDQVVLAIFDGAPTAGSETYNKLDKTVRDAYESQVRGDDADDPTIAAFGGTVAHYTPVPAKLVLQKKIAGEEKSNNEVEHFPDASIVTVRKRPTVTAIEKEGGVIQQL